MKKNLKRLVALLLVVLMVAAILPTAAFADEVPYEADAIIPFTLTTHGCAPGANPLDRVEGLHYNVSLFGEDAEPGHSMQSVDIYSADLVETADTDPSSPAGSSMYTYSGSFKLHYTKPGVYRYLVSQVRYFNGDIYCTYEEVFYNVSVNVVNNDKGGLTATVVIKNPDLTDTDPEHKPSTCAFNNMYGMNIDIAKKWSGISYYRPEVNVVLSHGDTVHNVSLSAENEWKLRVRVPYDHNDLDKPGLGYTIEEKPVPGGYYAVYSDPVLMREYEHTDAISGAAFEVTNYHVLIQTGQLNWPIPVLLGLGVLLIGAGVIMLSKKKKNNA